MNTLKILARFGRFYLATGACYALLVAGCWLVAGVGGVLIAAAIILAAELVVGPLRAPPRWPLVPWCSLWRLAEWVRYERQQGEVMRRSREGR